MPSQRLRAALLAILCCIGFSPTALAGKEGKACAAEPTDMLMHYGDLVTCAIDQVGDEDVFRFSGGTGETIRIQVSNIEKIPTDVYNGTALQLFDPDGQPLGNSLLANRQEDIILEQSGLYTIVVSENLRDQTVSYALALDRIDPPSPAARLIDYNEVIQDEINGVGDVDMFVVNGELGDTVRIGISIVERDVYDRYNGVCYKFYGPDGYSIGAEICNNRSQEFTIPRSGNYSVAVTEFGNDKTVVYGLNLACVSGICPDADVPEVSGCVSTQGTPLNSARVVLSQPDEPEQVARTDASGCYDFRKLVPGKPFDVHVLGSALSE